MYFSTKLKKNLIGSTQHVPLIIIFLRIVRGHPYSCTDGFGENIGGKSNIGRIVTASSVYCIRQCGCVGFHVPFIVSINDIKKRGFVLLSVPRIEALALPIMIEQTTSESTPI